MTNAISQQLQQSIHGSLTHPGAAKELITCLKNLPSDEETLALSAKVDEINTRVHLQPATAATTPAAGSANVSNVTIQVKDGDGNNLTGPTVIDVYLSDVNTGAALSATAASGGVAAGASGTVLQTLVTGKAVRMLTNATGAAVLAITDTGKTLYFPCVSIGGLKTVVGAQLITGNYG